MYKVCPHPYCDKFDIKDEGNRLIIRRTDSDSGWWFDLNIISPKGELINVGRSYEPVKILRTDVSSKNYKMLICIAFHYSENNLKYLKKVLNNIETYEYECHIVIDTNTQKTVDVLSSLYPKVEFIVHPNLENPYYLPCMHRKYIMENIDKYDFVMYSEDDILIPFMCIVDFLNKIETMWPKYIPAYRRLEWKNSEYHACDERFLQEIREQDLVHIEDLYGKKRTYYQSSIPYQAFWMLPTKFLKPLITPDFFYLSQDREHLASFPHGPPPCFTHDENSQNPRFLNKIPLFEVENGELSIKSCVYHLPNKYTDVYPIQLRRCLKLML